MRNLGFDALLDREVEEHFGVKQNKRYTGKVAVVHVVEVEVEAADEDAARIAMTTDALTRLNNDLAEIDIWDFTEIP